MSGKLSGVNESSLDEDDIAEIRERLKELTKEKELLRGSKSESLDLIRSLELYVKTLFESREEDRRHIADLERQVSNCSQEIDYLQDQLNMKNSEPEYRAAEVERLMEQLTTSESERFLLMQEIEEKEVLLRFSESHVEKLEESISFMSLEYQCEIESIKLESVSLHSETDKLLEEKARENSRLKESIQDLKVRNLDATRVIESLEKENKELKEILERSDARDGYNLGLFSSTKIAIPSASAADLQNKMAEMSRQIDDYEILVRRLKEELRDEKLKAKEEAEDLAQDMAELRYSLTLMLEQERKRRASVEQISLHRIAELEAQIAKERKNPVISMDLVVRNQ